MHDEGGAEGEGEGESEVVLLADEVLWCTQAAPPEWLAASGLPTGKGRAGGGAGGQQRVAGGRA